jgi:hypothetical protein
MAKMKRKEAKPTFKQKAADILNSNAGIGNIGEFLETPGTKKGHINNHPPANANKRRSTNTQIHIAPNTEKTNRDECCHDGPNNNHSEDRLVRIHVHIRKDLADRLIEEVYLRKRNSQINKKEATQRAIFEQALTEFFSRSTSKH